MAVNDRPTAATLRPNWSTIEPDAIPRLLGDLSGLAAEAMGWERIELRHPSRANSRNVFWTHHAHIVLYPDFTQEDEASSILEFLRERGLSVTIGSTAAGWTAFVGSDAPFQHVSKGESMGEALCRLVIKCKKARLLERHDWQETSGEKRALKCAAPACGTYYDDEHDLEKACPHPEALF